MGSLTGLVRLRGVHKGSLGEKPAAVRYPPEKTTESFVNLILTNTSPESTNIETVRFQGPEANLGTT